MEWRHHPHSHTDTPPLSTTLDDSLVQIKSVLRLQYGLVSEQIFGLVKAGKISPKWNAAIVNEQVNVLL